MSNLTFSGEINNFLMKPIGLYKWLLVKEVSEKFVSLVLFVPVGIILFSTFLTHSIPSSPNEILQLLFVLSLSFTLSFLVGILSFWIDEFWTISNIKSAIIALLGGVALPYVFFPAWVTDILHFTFFPYIVSWPARVLNAGLRLEEIMIAIVWIVITFIAIKLSLQISINKYSLNAG
jgi:ABC-2 type transport system permease protein